MPSASRVPLFLFVFTALFVFALAVTVTSQVSDIKWVQSIVSIGEGLGRLTFVSIAITFILVEGIPMLAAWYKKQMEVKAREEGREEGRDSERKAWQEWRREQQAWERRKAEAEQAGIAFTESPPAPPDADQVSAV